MISSLKKKKKKGRIRSSRTQKKNFKKRKEKGKTIEKRKGVV